MVHNSRRRDAFARNRSPRVASARVAHAVPGVFEMRCLARRRPARAALRRSHWLAPVRREMRAGRRERHNPQRSRECNHACIERGRSNPLGSAMAWRVAFRDRQKSAARWRGGVEPVLYTVEGRQTGDLRQKCGSALIRKAKLPARSCGRLSFLPGRLTDCILSASEPQGGGHASHFGRR